MGRSGSSRQVLYCVVLDVIGAAVQSLCPVIRRLLGRGRRGKGSAQLGDLHIAERGIGHRRQGEGAAVRQREDQGLTGFCQPQIFIKIRRHAALPELPPQLYRIVGAEDGTEGVNHLIHGPAIEGSDLLAQQGRVCRRSSGEIPPAALPGEGHGIKMYLRHEASSAA